MLVSSFDSKADDEFVNVENLLKFLKNHETKLISTLILKNILFYRNQDSLQSVSNLLETFIISLQSRKNTHAQFNEKYQNRIVFIC